MKDTSFVILLLLSSFVCLGTLTSCQAPEDGVEADPSAPSRGGTPWTPNPGGGGGTPQSPQLSFLTHQIPIAHPRGSLGGLDITYINGKLHAAFTMKVLDVDMGTQFYRLFYANNESGAWRIWYLRSSTSRFYRVRSGNQASNFLRIHRTREGNPYILFINYNNQLEAIYKENGTFYEKTLVTSEVGTFTSLLDMSNNKLHVATMARYYNTRDVKYHAFVDGNLVDSFIYSGSISPSSVESHLTMNLYKGQPIIFTKHYDSSLRTGRFLMIKDRQGHILANGVNAGGVFNTYWDEQGRIKSCYRNVLNERFEITVDLSRNTTNSRRAGFYREYQYPLHCFVSRYTQLPFARYNLNQTYSTNFEIYSWDGLGERDAAHFERKSIRHVDLRNGYVFFMTTDPGSGQPQFLQMQ